MQLAMIPFHDWKKCEKEGFRTRDAHLMQEFSKNSRVDKFLIINRPTSIPEMLRLRRSWQTKTGDVLFHGNGYSLKQVSFKTYVLDMLSNEFIRPIRMKRGWISHVFGLPRTVSIVQQVLDYLKMADSFGILMSAPLYVPLITELKPRVFALDAQDNLLKHSLYRDVPDLEKHYKFCQDHADLITTNSLETAQWLGKNCKNVHCIPNGVDTEIFRPMSDFQMPDDLKQIPHPIVGYAGKMQEMFDITLMEDTVSKLPQVSFVFLGQQLNPKWMAPLWRYPNTYYLGDKHYDSLNRYLAAFDICIIPYEAKRQHSGDPIKFYEYLAMGKPIVTTNIGNVGTFADYSQVCVAESSAEFQEGIHIFLDKIKTGIPIQQNPVPQNVLWKNKADAIIEMMIEKLK